MKRTNTCPVCEKTKEFQNAREELSPEPDEFSNFICLDCTVYVMFDLPKKTGISKKAARELDNKCCNGDRKALNFVKFIKESDIQIHT